MRYEVEQKFPVADMGAIRAGLTTLGAKIAAPQQEVDLYLAHPARDFAATDEALRLRQRGPQGYITYKGPKIDTTTKTRREIELPLGPGPEAFQSWTALLEAVGFRPVAEVLKSRRKAAVDWQGRTVEVSLDEVQDAGTFVEFELVVDQAELEAAKACIISLAQSFGLTQGERRSYLEMVLEGK
jgi:adenylate cyclase class 2